MYNIYDIRSRCNKIIINLTIKKKIGYEKWKNWGYRPTQNCHMSNAILVNDFNFDALGSFYYVWTL
jgi:hypothetical protein